MEGLASHTNESLAKVLGGISGDYDYGKGKEANSVGHQTDKGKLPWHPTFSNESAYASEGNPGGSWGNVDGKWVFTPSQQQMQTPGYVESLAQYYAQEKGKGIDKVNMPVPYRLPEELK